MTDYVSVKDLSVAAVIGVHAWEREIEQTLVFTVDMAADVRRAAASDDLADALDYSAVAGTIAAVVRAGKFRLIETAAERVAERLLADFPADLAPPRTPQAHHRRLPRRRLLRALTASAVLLRCRALLHCRHPHRTHTRNFMITKTFALYT